MPLPSVFGDLASRPGGANLARMFLARSKANRRKVLRDKRAETSTLLSGHPWFMLEWDGGLGRVGLMEKLLNGLGEGTGRSRGGSKW